MHFSLSLSFFVANNRNVMKKYWCGVTPEASHLVIMIGQSGRDIVQQIQIGTHSAFCTSSELPITVNTTAQTLAYVLTFAPSSSSFGANFSGLCSARGPNCAGGAWPLFITAFSSSSDCVFAWPVQSTSIHWSWCLISISICHNCWVDW